MSAALTEALDFLRRTYGPDPAAWRWGAAHPALFKHMVLADLPLVGASQQARVPSPGGDHTVNNGRMAARGQDFTSLYGPRYRQVIDLAHPEASLFMLTPGISGDPFSAHRRHLAAPWAEGQYLTLTGTEADLTAEGGGVTLLLPAGKP